MSRTKLVAIASTAALLALGAVSVALTRTEIEPGLENAKSGIVVDAQTRQPLAGVYVVARWLEQTTQPAWFGNEVTGHCLYRSVVRTGADGHYTIPAPAAQVSVERDWMPFREHSYSWDLYTYAPGYAPPKSMPKHPLVTALPAHAAQTLDAIALDVDGGGHEQRRAVLDETRGHFACRAFAGDANPIAHELAAEADAVAYSR